MGSVRAILLAAVIILMPGCGKEKFEGSYRDAMNPSITYRFRADGTWTAVMSAEVPSGIFPHGSGRRLGGSFVQRGEFLELECNSVQREDPVTGDFRPESAKDSSYNHRLRVEGGRLLPVGRQDGQSHVFASDLNPLGARELVPHAD